MIWREKQQTLTAQPHDIFNKNIHQDDEESAKTIAKRIIARLDTSQKKAKKYSRES